MLYEVKNKKFDFSFSIKQIVTSIKCCSKNVMLAPKILCKFAVTLLSVLISYCFKDYIFK